MIKIGEWNHLEVVKEKDFGIYLAEKKYDDEEVLLPKKQVPAGTRMGSGKGGVEYWAAVVKPGRVLFEMAGVSEADAREAMRLAGYKLPIKTKFVVKEKTTEGVEG